MKNYIKHYIWFWKESFHFMQGYNRLWVAMHCTYKAHNFSIWMLKYERGLIK